MLNSSQPVGPARARGFAAAAVALCAAGLLAAAPAAHAALGGGAMATPEGATLSSAPATAATSAATSTSATMRNALTTDMSTASGASTPAAALPYTVRETRLGTGTVIHEYLTQGGVVFGVAWQGKFLPPLADIFGDTYYQQYVAGAQAVRAARGGIARGPMLVDQSGLVVHSGGHPGGFAGSAWIPSLLPAGVTGVDIR
ncbi:DUF2844 domain-containing protein [Paraburkholderia jirisanensis]